VDLLSESLKLSEQSKDSAETKTRIEFLVFSSSIKEKEIDYLVIPSSKRQKPHQPINSKVEWRNPARASVLGKAVVIRKNEKTKNNKQYLLILPGFTRNSKSSHSVSSVISSSRVP
jgi:hypothetical protein